MGAYFDGMLRYFEFSGRSTRTQYWMFFLIQFALITAALLIDIKMHGSMVRHWSQMPITVYMVMIHLVPSITVQVRRLHDIGKSGFWYLVHLLPLGGIVLLYWACQGSRDTGDAFDQPAALLAALPHSTIPRGLLAGRALVAARVTREPAAGRFI